MQPIFIFLTELYVYCFCFFDNVLSIDVAGLRLLVQIIIVFEFTPKMPGGQFLGKGSIFLKVWIEDDRIS